jgi:glucose-1-phosphate cytidylyltransferase|tara:strand:- start:143 stop:841 length:699 start_codon:yes stop_codon:yes gene_type:complete
MKVIILAGGFGTRLSEYTNTIPKPMIQVGNKPILHHIMQFYANFGHTDFYVALGYKGEVIKKYFSNIDSDWNINLIDTGSNSMTGGRVKRLQKFIGKETFMLTYGDGLSDININNLISFHKNHGKMVTISAVRPPARFGALKLKDSEVVSFKEKSQLTESWINGGFFVMEPDFFEMLSSDETVLEKEPLEKAASTKELIAFRHEGFWQCMDHKLDKDLLDEMCSKKEAPWLK